MLVIPAIAIMLMVAQPIVSTTPEGIPLNPALVERNADQYLDRDISMTGILYECDGELCLTSVRIQVFNRLRIRLATPTLVQPLENTVYLPRTREAFWHSAGCEVRVVGIFTSEFHRPERHFLHVLAVTAQPEDVR
jgi:hypothetical protein